MAKTTNAVTQACAEVYFQPGCTGTKQDIGGETAMLTLPIQPVTHSSQAVFDDMTHILSAGKKEPVNSTVRIVYTEDAGEAWEAILAVWEAMECDQQVCIYAYPRGHAVGNRQILINGLLTGFKPPDLDAGSGEICMSELQIWGYYEYSVVT